MMMIAQVFFIEYLLIVCPALLYPENVRFASGEGILFEKLWIAAKNLTFGGGCYNCTIKECEEKQEEFMKRKYLLVVLTMLCALFCALGLAGCGEG